MAAWRDALAAAGRMEEKEPLKAAEAYSRIVKELSAARGHTKSQAEEKEISSIIAEARKGFDVCEKRILRAKAEAAAAPKKPVPAVPAPAPSGDQQPSQAGSWFSWANFSQLVDRSDQRPPQPADSFTYASVQRCENSR
eukprot:748328-Hanusia_phi.AAC.4